MIQNNNGEKNQFEIFQERIDATCSHLPVCQACVLMLKECKRESTVHFPVKMDNGLVRMFTGYRVQHNDTRGPFKGGIRFHKLHPPILHR